MTLHTIGYEGIDIERFMALLRKHAVKTVVDIRELPLSRKPGFSKTALSDALRRRGLKYLHVAELGCPRDIRNSYRDDGNWARYTQRFSKYLDSQQEALQELASTATTSTCALLCFEADHNRCHRSIVSAAIHRRAKIPVSHIQVTGTKTAAPGDLSLAFA